MTKLQIQQMCALRFLLTLFSFLFTAGAALAQAPQALRNLVEAMERLHAKRQQEASSGRLVATLVPENGYRIADVALCGDGRTLMSQGGSDKDVLIWDWQDKKVIRHLPRNKSGRAIACRSDATVFANGDGQLLRVWKVDQSDIREFDISSPFDIQDSRDGAFVKHIFFTPDGEYLFAHWIKRSYFEKRLKDQQRLVMYEVATLKVIREIDLKESSWSMMPARGHNKAVYAYAYLDSSGVMSISIINPLRGQEIAAFQFPVRPLSAIAFGQDDETIIFSYGTKGRPLGRGTATVAVRNFKDGQTKGRFAVLTNHVEAVGALAHDKESDLIVATGGDGTIELLAASTGELVETLGDRLGKEIYSAALDSNGYLFTADGDRINVWLLPREKAP